MTPITATEVLHALVRHGLITGMKPAIALQTVTNTCSSGSTCTQVQNDPTASKALAGLQAALATSQTSETARAKLATQYTTARRQAKLDFRGMQLAVHTYESAVAGIGGINATIIGAAGLLARPDGGAVTSLEAVSTVSTKLGKLPGQAIVSWPEAPGATSYAIEVNFTPQNPSGPWTSLNAGTRRRRTITAPAPGAQCLVRIAAQASDGTQAPWSIAILATAR